MTLTFKFPSKEVETQAVHELSEHFGYPAKTQGEPVNVGTKEEPVMERTMIDNPMSREAWCQEGIKKMVVDIVRERLLKRSLDAAKADLEATLSAITVS